MLSHGSPLKVIPSPVRVMTASMRDILLQGDDAAFCSSKEISMATCPYCNGHGGKWVPGPNGMWFSVCGPCGGRRYIDDPAPPLTGGPNLFGGGPQPGAIDPRTYRNTVIIVLAALFLIFVVFPGIAALVLMSKLSQVICAVTHSC